MDFLTYHVYVDKRPDGIVFYVGKGKKNRVEKQVKRNIHWQRTVEKHCGFQREVVFSTDIEEEAFAKERELIAFYGRANLCNMTDGGEGQCGVRFTDERKQEISKRFKGFKKPDSRIQYLKDRVYSEETRAKISAGNSKRRFSKETKEKMRQAKLGKKASLATKARISQTLIGNQRNRKKYDGLSYLPFGEF